jgi:periplasmic protein TonB
MAMRTKLAIAASAFAMLLCTSHALHAQDAPDPSAPAAKPAASATTSHPTRVRIGGNVQMAKMIHQVQPKYPNEAKQNHITGTIVLHAVISKDGSIQELQFVSGPPELMRSAMDAVKKWRYKPTELEGRPVEVDTTISVVYTLSG